MKRLILIVLFCLLSSASGQMSWTRACESAPWGGQAGWPAVVFKDTIWFFSHYGRYREDLWCSIDGADWICMVESLPWGKRSQIAALVFRGEIWVLGGVPDSNGRFSWHSADGVNWTKVLRPIPWGPAWHHRAVVFQDKIWVFSNSHNEVWCSADGDSWIRVAESTPWPRRILYPLIVFDNKMWVMGGWIWPEGEPERNVNDIWCSADGVNWQCVRESAPWTPREGHTAVVKDSVLWLIGGRWDLPEPQVDIFYNDVWYTTNGDSWICATDSAEWSGRWDHSSVVFDSCLWVLAGNTRQGSTNDVWYSTGLGSGVIEEFKPIAQPVASFPTVIRRDINLTSREGTVLLDITGRQVAVLKPGANHIRLEPGVYFMQTLQTNAEKQRQKVIVIE